MVITNKYFNLVRLSVVLYLMGIFNSYSNGQTTPDKLNIFADVWYQCYSNNSFLSQIPVRRSVHCAGQCLRNTNCQTATFNQADHLCSLYSEPKELGQLLPKNEAFIFERERTYSTAQTRTTTSTTSATMKTSTTTTARSTTRSPCINVTIPSNADGWICANAVVSLTGGANRIFYCEQGARLTVLNVGGNNNLYLKSGVTFTANGGYFTGYSTGSVSSSVNGNGGISMSGCSSLTFDYSNAPSSGCINA